MCSLARPGSSASVRRSLRALAFDQGNQGFTLPEILMVIAISAVLLGLVVGGAARVRESANSVRCTSNLHQIAVAASLFAQDHGGVLPGPTVAGQPFRYRGYDSLSEIRSLANLLVGYLGLPESQDPREWLVAPMFQCPSVLRKGRGVTIDFHYGQFQTYHEGEIRDRPFGYGNSTVGVTQRPLRLSRMEHPASIILLADRTLVSVIGEDAHGLFRNVVFADGSVKAVPSSAFKARAKESWELVW